MSPYSESERRIFSYPQGPNLPEVFADPLEIEQELTIKLNGDLHGVINAARGKQERGQDNKVLPGQPPEEPQDVLTRLLAEKQLVAAVREVFNLPPVDPQTGNGATLDDCRRALNSFLAFREKH